MLVFLFLAMLIEMVLAFFKPIIIHPWKIIISYGLIRVSEAWILAAASATFGIIALTGITILYSILIYRHFKIISVITPNADKLQKMSFMAVFFVYMTFFLCIAIFCISCVDSSKVLEIVSTNFYPNDIK